MAFSPIHALAECAATPCVTTSNRMVPLQPPSMPQSVGSPMIAKSPASQSGCASATFRRPFFSAATSSWS